MSYPSHYLFPAVFAKSETGYGIHFPDIPGAVTVAEDVTEGIRRARELLAFALRDLAEQGKEIPKPSEPKDVRLEDPQHDRIVYIDVWMSLRRRTK